MFDGEIVKKNPLKKNFAKNFAPGLKKIFGPKSFFKKA